MLGVLGNQPHQDGVKEMKEDELGWGWGTDNANPSVQVIVRTFIRIFVCKK
jgi:hypothetical protein